MLLRVEYLLEENDVYVLQLFEHLLLHEVWLEHLPLILCRYDLQRTDLGAPQVEHLEYHAKSSYTQ